MIRYIPEEFRTKDVADLARTTGTRTFVVTERCSGCIPVVSIVVDDASTTEGVSSAS